MLTLTSEIKFLTCNDDININNNDFGAFKYKDRKIASTSTNQTYDDGKQQYAHSRDHQYNLHGRKTKQIRNYIQKLQELLKHNKIVFSAWNDSNMIQMLLSNGVLVHISLNVFTGDIKRIAYDRFFVGKLISESVTDVIISKLHIIISYDINQLTFVYMQKPSNKRNAPGKIHKLDPKIFNTIINGPSTKKISRHLACNTSFDLLAVWTKSSQNEVYPWRPTIRDQDRANIHIYKLSQSKLEMLSYYWTENDPISVEFSKNHQNQLRSIEQKMSRKGEVTAEIYVYETIKSKFQRISTTSIPLQSQVCCHALSPDCEKLMLGCIDGSVILYDEGRGITHSIKAAFIPTLVSFHADSAILMIANEKSQFQFYDVALSCIRNLHFSEDMTTVGVLDFSSYFATQPSLLKISCSKKTDLMHYNESYCQCDSFVLCLFGNGPITMLRLFGGNGHKGDFRTSGYTVDVLIEQYLKLNSVEKAINMLLCLNWDAYGSMLMISLHRIANYILRQPFQPERELQLQKALGSFLVPIKPLRQETQIEFGDQIRDITRIFFQYLLRNKSYKKAFNLAIDIDDEDIFMDLSNCAKDDDLLALAHDAFRNAELILKRSYSVQSNVHSDSLCSHDSCSNCANTSSDDESDAQTRDAMCRSKNKNAPKFHRHLESSKYDSNILIPKPELNVSNFPKTLVDFGSSSSISRCKSEPVFNVDRSKLKYIADGNNIKAHSIIQSTIPQQHHVIEIVPKPQYSDWKDIPEQTIGIPITNSIPRSNIVNATQNMSRSMGRTIPPVILHPLATGNIPASLNKKRVDSVPNAKSSILMHQMHNLKKDSGEKNKVKFSNTVQVAVVPDISKKRNFNDDYFKVFTPIRTQDDSVVSKSDEKGVLTWV